MTEPGLQLFEACGATWTSWGGGAKMEGTLRGNPWCFLAGKIWQNHHVVSCIWVVCWFGESSHGSEPTKSSLWCSRFREENHGESKDRIMKHGCLMVSPQFEHQRLKMIENWRPSLGYQERVGKEKHSILWKADHYPPSMAAFFHEWTMHNHVHINMFIHYKIEWCFTGLKWFKYVLWPNAPPFSERQRRLAQLGAAWRLVLPELLQLIRFLQVQISALDPRQVADWNATPQVLCTDEPNRWTDERWKKGSPILSPWRSLFSTIHSMTKEDDKACWFGFLHQTSIVNSCSEGDSSSF